MKSDLFIPPKTKQSNEKNLIIKDTTDQEWILIGHKDMPEDLLNKICLDIFSNIFLSKAPLILTGIISWTDSSQIKVEIIGSSKPSNDPHIVMIGKDDTNRDFSICMPLSNEKDFEVFNKEKLFLSRDLHLILNNKAGPYKLLADFLSLENLKPKKEWEVKLKLKDFEKKLAKEAKHIRDPRKQSYFRRMAFRLIEDLKTDIPKAQAEGSDIILGSNEIRNSAVEKIREVAQTIDIVSEVDRIFKKWQVPIPRKIKLVLSQVLMRMQQEN